MRTKNYLTILVQQINEIKETIEEIVKQDKRLKENACEAFDKLDEVVELMSEKAEDD